MRRSTKTKNVIHFLEKEKGFVLTKQHSSHRTFRCGSIVVLISEEDREEIGYPRWSKILKHAHVNPDEFGNSRKY